MNKTTIIVRATSVWVIKAGKNCDPAQQQGWRERQDIFKFLYYLEEGREWFSLELNMENF